MTNDRVDKKLYEWKPISGRLAGRTKIIWENGIKEDLRIIKINNWAECFQDVVKWKKVV